VKLGDILNICYNLTVEEKKSIMRCIKRGRPISWMGWNVNNDNST